MRKFLFTALATLSLFSCAKNELDNSLTNTEFEKLIVAFDEESTRVELNSNLQTVWNEGDALSVFFRSTANGRWIYTGEDGARTGELTKDSNTADVGSNTKVSNIVALYPYAADATLNSTATALSTALSAEQSYNNASFGVGSSIMVSAGDSRRLTLRNVCGWLRVELTGEGTVDAITLRGNNGETLAGAVTIDPTTAEVASATGSASELSLLCDGGVTLSTATPTPFYFAIIPQVLSKGFTVEATIRDQLPATFRVEESVSIERNHILPYGPKAIEEGQVIPVVKLIADKTSIEADGEQTVTFSVTANDVAQSEGVKIINADTEQELDGFTFSTTTVGSYTFYATYGHGVSESVTITATTPRSAWPLTLVVNPKTIDADGKSMAAFDVKHGSEDVTLICDIKCGDTILEHSYFTTTTAGTYTFTAEYEGKVSNSVTVTAVEVAPPAEFDGKPGDYYNQNGVEGVIFAIESGYCYIMSLDEADLQWSTENVQCNCFSQNGYYNTHDPFDYYGMDINKYPAFKWCMDHGDGWFLPSSRELNWMWTAITDGERDFNAAKVAEYNNTLVAHGGKGFEETYYWTSNETSDYLVEVVAFMNDSVVCLDPQKSSTFTARAVYKFKL